jgi:hypothetical protein
MHQELFLEYLHTGAHILSESWGDGCLCLQEESLPMAGVIFCHTVLKLYKQ